MKNLVNIQIVQKVDKCRYSKKVKDDDKDGSDNPNDIEDDPSKVEHDADESMVDESDSPSDPPVDETPVSTPPWRKVGRPKKGSEMDLRNENRFIIPVSGSDGKSTYQCAECSVSFPRKWSMLMHVRSHTKVLQRFLLKVHLFYFMLCRINPILVSTRSVEQGLLVRRICGDIRKLTQRLEYAIIIIIIISSLLVKLLLLKSIFGSKMYNKE